MVGGKAAVEAGAVNAEPVRCSAWLGDVGFGLIGELRLDEVSKPRKLCDSAPIENPDDAMASRHDE